MLLLELPSELILQIFEAAGTAFFREDIRRLTVCKSWFQHARAVCYKNLILTQQDVRRLFSSERLWPARVRFIKRSLETLDLRIQGFEDCIFEHNDWIAEYDDWISNNDSDVPQRIPYTLGPDGEPRYRLVTAWTAPMERNLSYISFLVRMCPKIRTICIQTLSEHYCDHPFLPRPSTVPMATIQEILSTERLQVLELDFRGTLLVQRSHHGGRDHICGSIGRLLPTIRRLRLRMRTICPAVLSPPRNIARLRLKEVYINLSLSHMTPIAACTSHSLGCNTKDLSFRNLRAAIECQAKLLAARMESPNAVRILHHRSANSITLEMHTLDILTGSLMVLEDWQSWEEDGVVVEQVIL